MLVESASPTTWVITGTGGVGKTQLAARVWSRLNDRWEYGDEHEPNPIASSISIWVTASSRAQLISDYAVVGRALKLATNETEAVQARALLNWLEASPVPWLLVLDDLADPSDITGMWPSTARAGSAYVLVTTRRQDPVMFRHGRRRIHLGVFSETDSAEFLERRTRGSRSPSSPADLGELTQALGHLPLALGQAAAYIVDTGMSCADYVVMLRDSAQELSRLTPVDHGEDYPIGTASCWSLSLDRADAMQPVGMARRVANLFSVLDTNGFPSWVLNEIVPQGYLQDISALELRTMRWTNWSLKESGLPSPEITIREREATSCAVENLRKLSIIESADTGSIDALRMHQLTQRSIWESLTDAEQRKVVNVAADALTRIWVEPEPELDWAPVLRRNANAIWSAGGPMLFAPDGHPLLWRLGTSLETAGQVESAFQYWTSLEETSLRTLGPQHSDTQILRLHCAICLKKLGKKSVALSMVEQVLADSQRWLPAEDPVRLEAMMLYADLRIELGDAGLEALDEVVEAHVKLLGSKNLRTLKTMVDVARRCMLSQDYKRARTLLKRAISLRPHFTSAAVCLAELLGLQGNPEAAVKQLSKALHWWPQASAIDGSDDARRYYFDDHNHAEDFLFVAGNLGYWQRQSGDLNGALDTFISALPTMFSWLRGGHPWTILTELHIAEITFELGDHERGLVLINELLTKLENSLDAEDGRVVDVQRVRSRMMGSSGTPMES
jgi:tetratricopeptide (TPR) repeat protein